MRKFIAKHATTVSLIGITLAALVLRLYHLNYQSYGVDEIATMNGADPDLSWSAVIAYSKVDQPPSFFLLLHAWLKVFPFNDFSGRMLAVIVGIAGIVAVFFLGKEVKDSRAGLFASFITSLSYIHLYFSQETRFYTLVFLFSTLSYLFFIRAVKKAGPADFVLYSLFTSLLLYTHYFGLVVFASQGIIFLLLILFFSTPRRFIIVSVVCAVLITISIIPWIPTFFSDAQTEVFWIPSEPFYFPLRYFYVYFKDVVSCVVFAVVLGVYFLNLYKRFKANRSMDRVDLILIGGVAFSFLIPVVYSLLKTPMLNVRYTLIALPSLIVMISLGFTFLKARLQSVLVILICCTTLFSLTVIEQYYTKRIKEDWRGLINVAIERGAPTDVFVSKHSWYCNYYFKSLHSSYRAILPDQFNAEGQKPQGVWWMDGFDVKPTPDPVEVKLLKTGYSLKKTDSLYRARASYYTLSP